MRKLIVVVALFVLACHQNEAPRNPNVILISIDTLRSDHLPAYGYRAIATPNIDRLANDGVVFEHAYANVPLTLPSHATIMTGLLPAEHGVRDNAGYTLDAKTTTIASMLHARGYATGAAVSAYVLRHDSNINQGFDEYDDRIEFIEGAPTGNLQRNGNSTASILTKWMDSHSSTPFFAFAHLFEPHTPYEPSYDGEIAKADRIVGALLDHLREKNLYDDALIILLSDHGEGLNEHGEAEHGVLLYRESLQVPLIVKLPRNMRHGERVRQAAQLADILPTIAAITGATAPHVRGQSLLATMSDRPIHSETLYPRIHLGWSELRSIIRYPMHLIDGPKPEVYDLASDPREGNDVREEKRREYAQLERDLALFPKNESAAPTISNEERQKLAALGYVSAGAPAQASNLNPRDHLADLAELKTITELMAHRDYRNATTRIEALLARNPGWSDLRNDLGLAYEQLGDLSRAEQTYRDAIRATPELASDFALSLAQILAQERKFDDAIAHANLAMRSNPAGAHDVLARVAIAQHDLISAMTHAQAMRSNASMQSNADVLIAQILIEQRKFDEALATLDQIRARRTALPPRYWFLTGDALASLGRTEEARAAFDRAIHANPREREAYVSLAFVEAASGNRDAANELLDRMIAAIPESRGEAERVRRELARH